MDFNLQSLVNFENKNYSSYLQVVLGMADSLSSFFKPGLLHKARIDMSNNSFQEKMNCIALPKYHQK